MVAQASAPLGRALPDTPAETRARARWCTAWRLDGGRRAQGAGGGSAMTVRARVLWLGRSLSYSFKPLRVLENTD